MGGHLNIHPINYTRKFKDDSIYTALISKRSKRGIIYESTESTVIIPVSIFASKLKDLIIRPNFIMASFQRRLFDFVT